MMNARICSTRSGGHEHRVTPPRSPTAGYANSSKSSFCQPFSTIWRSGAIRSTSSARRCPRPMRKAIWRCESGPPSSMKGHRLEGTDMTDAASETRGGFPDVRPVEDAPQELDRFVAALRQLEDLTVSTRPDSALWTAAAEHIEKACALLDGHQVPEIDAVAGRVLRLPGLGHPLLPPWTLTEAGPDGVTMGGHFTQAHVGGNHAVH